MSAIDWDAIVIGAGPAGASLACRLRPRYRVLLLEREAAALPYRTAPRIGESLPGAARGLLQTLGVLDRFIADGHAQRTATISCWDRETPVWFDPLRDPSGPGWHLDRVRFDQSLRGAAADAGAVLLEDCGRLHAQRTHGQWQVQAEDLGQTHRAPVLVDAGGRSGTIARRLGLKRHEDDALVCLHAHLPAAASDVDRCTRICADDNGWWYSVRVPSGQRVLAFHLEAQDRELGALRTASALLEKARRQPLLAEVLPAHVEVPVHARPAGSGRLAFEALGAQAPGFYAVGDAAIAFDPIASQGLFHALASAESVARAIDRQFAGDSQAQAPYIAEMHSVYARYRMHLQATYAGPRRFARHPFWASRAAAHAHKALDARQSA